MNENNPNSEVAESTAYQPERRESAALEAHAGRLKEIPR